MSSISPIDSPSIAASYSSLLSLSLLHPNEDLSKFVNISAIAKDLSLFQLPDGSFRAQPETGEHDARMCFCACATAALCNNDFSGINKASLLSYLDSLQTYEGGFGGEPGSEAHSGYTFCAVGCYVLMGEQERIPNRSNLLRFLTIRQQRGGFNGRTNKLEDVCYTWWNGATLKMLGHRVLFLLFMLVYVSISFYGSLFFILIC